MVPPLRFLLWAVFACAALLAQSSSPPPLQQPWQGVPETYRNLPIGKFQIPATLDEWKSRRPE